MDKIKHAIEMMAKAKRPIFYTGGGVINSGPNASTLLRELVRADRLPDHLDADGARRLSGLRQAMARHARHARLVRGQQRDARLRPDDLRRRALRRPHHRPPRRLLAALARRSTSTSIRRRSTRTSRSISAIIGDCAHVLEDMVRLWRTELARPPTRRRSPNGGSRSTTGGARIPSASAIRSAIIKPQHAIQRLYELTKDRDVYITTEVGQHQMWAAQHFASRSRTAG